MCETQGTKATRVLFVSQNVPSFVAADLDTVSSAYPTEQIVCRTPLDIVRALAMVPDADLVLLWFGSTRFLPIAFLARLLRKPVVIVAGGYDVAAEPSIRYGNMLRPVPRILGRALFGLASMVVPFSESAADEARRNARVPARKIRTVPLGFDASRFPPRNSDISKEPLVLTVGVADASTIHRKGLLDVARASRLLPDVQFVFAGQADAAALAQLHAVAGPNATFRGRVSAEELASLFRRAAVYAQPSIHEGFGSAVAEAMLYECVPVISRTHSLPEVVGGTGIYVPPGDVGALVPAIREALIAPPTRGAAARRRILRMFPATRRRTELLSVLDEIGGRPAGAAEAAGRRRDEDRGRRV